MSAITVSAVDDHPIVLWGLGAVIGESAQDIRLLAVTTTVDELLAEHEATDVVALDLMMARPIGQSIETDVRRVVARGSKVLVFTSEERPVPVRRAIEAGASGLLLKVDPIEHMVETIRDVAAGDFVCRGPVAQAILSDTTRATRLSSRQLQTLRLIAEGATQRQAGKAAGIAESTVREYINRVAAEYRGRGIEPGNAHGVVTQARREGHLEI